MANWHTAWESLDVEQYLAFYDEAFDNGQKDYTAWLAHKRRVGAQKEFIDVDISNVSLLRYPGNEMLIQAEFKQQYKSNNFSGSDIKRQYWRQQQNGSWRIIYEASI